MTPSERLRRLLKPIPRPMIFLDLALGSDYARRAITSQLRADTAAAKLRAELGIGSGPIPAELEDEITRRAAFVRHWYSITGTPTMADWSPLASAVESVREDIQTGRLPWL